MIKRYGWTVLCLTTRPRPARYGWTCQELPPTGIAQTGIGVHKPPYHDKVTVHKSKIRIGCWNVRTLYQAGKLAQLAKEMRRYKLSIIVVCESRWNTFGKVTTSSGETYLYSGNEREEDAHTQSHMDIPRSTDGKPI